MQQSNNIRIIILNKQDQVDPEILTLDLDEPYTEWNKKHSYKVIFKETFLLLKENISNTISIYIKIPV